MLKRLRQLFTRLSSKTIHGPPLGHIILDPPLYARGKQEVLDKKYLYGTIDCTSELFDVNCKKYLDVAINELLDRSYRMRGRHAIYGSY
ncbi:unnamed protein product [Prunus brigantina]